MRALRQADRLLAAIAESEIVQRSPRDERQAWSDGPGTSAMQRACWSTRAGHPSPRLSLVVPLGSANSAPYRLEALHMGACAECGKGFLRKTTGRRRVYCSDTCKAAAGLRRAEIDGRAERWRAAARTRRLVSERTGVCAQCGEEFRFTHKRRYCSRPCCNRAYAERRKQRENFAEQKQDAKRRRVARQRGAKHEPVSRRRVFERDSWVCGICETPTLKEVKVPHPLAPTLDHVIPLALGGDHTYANSQTAHFICNSVKSDRVDYKAATPEEVTNVRTSTQGSVDPSAA
jgi:5-methylcytosine-specific restriction endonuclease McrA